MADDPQTEIPLDLLDTLDEALENDARAQVRALLVPVSPAEIARLLEALPPAKRGAAWKRIDLHKKGDVLLAVNDAVRTQLIEEARPAELVLAIRRLDLDELADIHGDLPANVVKAVIRAMDDQRRERFDSVLSYPEDTAGGLMNTDTVAVRSDVTLKVAIRYLRRIRKRQGQLPELTDNLMVVDVHNRYLGVLSLTELISNDPDRTISEIMDRESPALDALLPATQVARHFEDLDLVSTAVINRDGKLVGRITVDDVLDVIRDEANRTVMNAAGLDEETDMFAPVWTSARRRAIWLGINLITAFLAAWVIDLFQATIAQLVALAVLMPIVASMGGIAGTQTLTLVTRAIALDQVGASNLFTLMWKELAIGSLNGVIWALVVAAVAVWWFSDWGLGGVIGVAIIINLAAAALAGASIPVLLHRAGIDPALAGGMVLTTVTDVVGFLSFLGLATVFLL